jgi:arginase
MRALNDDIEIISAPSILGLQPTGVEELGESLLAAGLAGKLKCIHPVIHVPTLNSLYNDKRDPETKCLNAIHLRDFSLTLGNALSATITNKRFPFVLGGDCSILLGIFSALKAKGNYGLIFLDAHADFYEPERSITGEVADMDLAIITGRGPALLTNIDQQHPYIKDEHVIHIGQRDREETRKYRSRDIRDTSIQCISLAAIERNGIQDTCTAILETLHQIKVEGFWIHFDTDVLSDEINPAVDYRLPGGLLFEETEYLLRRLLLTGRIAGISVTIFNPRLDHRNQISNNIAESLGRAFDLSDG